MSERDCMGAYRSFQPGEEGFAGGRLMIEEGVLEASGSRPVAAYALHVDCVTPRGALVTRSGAILASVSALRATVHGTGGHASSPHLGVDPVPIAAELVLAVQSFAARRIAASEAAVLSVTKIRSDSEAGNVIPASVDLELNIRTLSRETLELVRDELPGLLTGIAAAHGATLDAEWIPSYPVTYNDPAETEPALAALRAAGHEITLLPEPAMASEDFAYVLEEVPGTFVFVGATPEGGAGPMHSELAAFDDSVLGLQAQVLAELAWARLERG